MDFYTDEDSFGAPYDRAPQEAQQAFLDAGRTVEGANARAEEAERAIEDLLLFRKQLAGLIRDEGFARLPRLRGAWLRRIEHYRHLTVGVWRGLLLVAADGSAAVAVIFFTRTARLHGSPRRAQEQACEQAQSSGGRG